MIMHSRLSIVNLVHNMAALPAGYFELKYLFYLPLLMTVQSPIN